MSGPAIHHIIAKEVAKSLKSKLDPSYHPFLNRLDGDLASAFYLGAQGPDFLFFNTKDIHPTLKKFVDYYLEITDFMEEIKETILSVIPDELKEAVETLEEVYDDVQARSSTLTEISELLTDARNLIEQLKDVITAKLEEYVTTNFQIFDLLANPIQDDQDFKDWWWFDTLHYRRTGKYAETLLKNSQPDTIEHAYALGYLTHYSADIVGHPFVNIISGGPYRTHAKRHKVVENHQDTMAYKNYTNGEEFVKSKLGEEYVINGDERRLPNNLNDLILKSIEEVYFKDGHPQYGKPMSKDDLNDAYRLWLMWFRKSTNAMQLPPPEPYSFTEEIEEVWDTFVDNLQDLGESIGDGLSGDAGILGILKGLAMAALSPLLAAAAAIDALLGAITTIGAAPLRFFIALAYDELYNSYLNLHQAIVLNGFGFPINNELSHYSIQHVFDTSKFDVINHNASSLMNYYPTKKFKPVGMECESHLIYPIANANNVESDKCTGAPKSYYSATAEKYMFGPLAFNRDYYEFLKKFNEKPANANSSETNHNFEYVARIAHQEIFGSAVDFSCVLYEDFIQQKGIADFNLDADRGIGYKSWRKVDSFHDINNEQASDVGVEPDETVPHVQTDIIDPSLVIL